MLTKSPSVAALSAALAKFNREVISVSKDAKNPFFRSEYATLDNILNAVRPMLSDNGLSVCQFLTGENEMTCLLTHDSGEWVEGTFKLSLPTEFNKETKETVTKYDPQAFGSAVTYARRYSLASMLGIATEKDDDAEKAMEMNRQGQYAPPRPVSNEPRYEKTETQTGNACDQCGGFVKPPFKTCYPCKMGNK